MAATSYQMERLLDRLRRLRGWFAGSAHRPSARADPVQVTKLAWERARAVAGPPAGTPRQSGPPAGTPRQGGIAGVAEPGRYPPLVEAERERRAGSFMRPPYPEQPPASHIPRLRRVARKRPTGRPLAEAD